MHVVVKGGSVAVVIVVSVCDEQVGVDHLVEQSLHKVLPGTQLEQGHAQPEKKHTLEEQRLMHNYMKSFH